MYQFNIFDYAAQSKFNIGSSVMCKESGSIGVIVSVGDYIEIKFPDKRCLVPERYFDYFFVIY